MTELGWTGEQGAWRTFCGNKPVKPDNWVQSETSAFEILYPSRTRNRRRPGMTGRSLMSASADSRRRSESFASGLCVDKRWRRMKVGAWTRF